MITTTGPNYPLPPGPFANAPLIPLPQPPVAPPPPNAPVPAPVPAPFYQRALSSIRTAAFNTLKASADAARRGVAHLGTKTMDGAAHAGKSAFGGGIELLKTSKKDLLEIFNVAFGVNNFKQVIWPDEYSKNAYSVKFMSYAEETVPQNGNFVKVKTAKEVGKGNLQVKEIYAFEEKLKARISNAITGVLKLSFCSLVTKELVKDCLLTPTPAVEGARGFTASYLTRVVNAPEEAFKFLTSTIGQGVTQTAERFATLFNKSYAFSVVPLGVAPLALGLWGVHDLITDGPDLQPTGKTNLDAFSFITQQAVKGTNDFTHNLAKCEGTIDAELVRSNKRFWPGVAKVVGAWIALELLAKK